MDQLIEEIRSRHIQRLQAGQCTIQLGFVLSDLLTNIERVCDHCSNIAVSVIEEQDGGTGPPRLPPGGEGRRRLRRGPAPGPEEIPPPRGMRNHGQTPCAPSARGCFLPHRRSFGYSTPLSEETYPYLTEHRRNQYVRGSENSETLKNLMRAFAGESQARNRYTFAASVCRQQKLHVVEAVFRFTADQEKEHAEIFYNHMKEMAGQTVAIDGTYPVDLTNDVKELLRKAQHNEYEEHDPVYRTFGDVARQEGFSAVAASFHKIAEIEEAPRQPVRAVWADLLEQGKLFVSDVQCAWMCLNCGYLFEGTEGAQALPGVPARPGLLPSVWRWRPSVRRF